MQKEFYLINEAAKEVHVEAHVLRYWEEELGMNIKRNQKGHRLYTAEDVLCFQKIKELKDEGLQLKAVKKIMEQDGEEEKKEYKIVNFQIKNNADNKSEKVSDIIASLKEEKRNMEKQQNSNEDGRKQGCIEQDATEVGEISVVEKNTEIEEKKLEKLYRIQVLFKHLIQDAMSQSQKELVEQIKENMAKEFSYQMSMLQDQQTEIEKRQIQREEKREEEKKIREEKHFKEIDELLRLASTKRKAKKIL